MFNSILVVSILLVVAVTGFIATKLTRLSPRHLILGISGAIVGLLLGALLSVPLGRLPSPYGSLLPIVVTVLVTLLMITVFINQTQHTAGVASWFKAMTGQRHSRPDAVSSGEILVDTSVIIDGRIADIAGTGFIPGRLLVPRFVLAELQNIADSDDSMRRSRGRRGLEMLNTIQGTAGIQLEIIEDDIAEIREVDAKLVALAKQRGADILTTDYNLNRVAQIEGVKVLNINELSNAIRPVVLPGEDMLVKIVQAGKERNQGVGYLPDGTMIVVENGDKMIGQEVATEVTRVFQTVAGKMIFATPKKAGASGNGHSRNQRQKPRQRHDNGRTNDNAGEVARDAQSTAAIESRLIEETSKTD